MVDFDISEVVLYVFLKNVVSTRLLLNIYSCWKVTISVLITQTTLRLTLTLLNPEQCIQL